MKENRKVFLTGIEKVAILMNVLGKERSFEIMKGLKDSDIRRLLQVMGSMKKAPLSIVNSVLREYLYKINETDELIFEDNITSLEQVSRGLGDERAKHIIGTSKVINLVNRKSLTVLDTVDHKVLAEFLIDEHPQTIALIIAHMDLEKQIAMIKLLPESLRAEIILRMSTVDYIEPEKVDELDEMIQKELRASGKLQYQPVGGISSVADLVNSLDKRSMESLMYRLEEKDPVLAEELRQHMFMFVDIVKIDQKGIQLILREVPNDVLLLALKGAPSELMDKILSCLSSRAAQMMKEDLEDLGPQKVTEVESAQRTIIKIIRRLEEEGKLVIGIGDGHELIP